MRFKRLAVTVLAMAMLVSAMAIPASASTGDSNYSIGISSTSGVYANSITVRKKDDTTSAYVNYNLGGPYKFVALFYGASSSDGFYTDCTTYIYGTNIMRRQAIVTSGTKGFVHQDVREKYGQYAWASIRGKYNSGLGTASGKWSPDSMDEYGCVDYNG